jgi:hypothetical protein
MKPKLCKAGIQLREQLTTVSLIVRVPQMAWIGDSKHSTRKSDHNPDEQGWVRAIDISRDLSGKTRADLMPDLADQLRIGKV